MVVKKATPDGEAGNIKERGKDGRWEGPVHRRARSGDQARPIYKNVLGRTQAEAKSKLKAAIEETKSLDVTKTGKYTVGAWMDEWFENYAKDQSRGHPPTRPIEDTSTTTSSQTSGRFRWKNSLLWSYRSSTRSC